jgi:aerobic carbon-monoxide dehydrogenase medium subunit
VIADLTYHRPASVGEAAGILAAEGPGAAVLGGGTMLVPLLVRRQLAVSHVVDLCDLGLEGIGVSGDGVEIGARVSYADVIESADLAAAAPLLPRMAAGITGGAQIRNQGTIGGSACYANPASDVPACLVALDATMRLEGPAGARDVAAADFFVDAFASARTADELLVSLAIPRRSAAYGYAKLKLSESSWPIATAVAVRRPDGGATLTVGGVRSRPLQVELEPDTGADDFDELIGPALDESWADVLADGEYRKAVAPAVARRAWAEMVANDEEQRQ